MKNSTTRRLLALLLSLMMILALSPTALLTEATTPENPGGSTTGPDDSNDPDDTPGTSGPVTKLVLACDNNNFEGIAPNYKLQLEPNSASSQGVRVVASLEPADSTTNDLRVVWNTSDRSVATVIEDTGSATGRTVYIVGHSPGTATITASVSGITHEIKVTVSGIKLLTTEISMLENESKTIREGTDYELYGRAASDDAKLSASVVNDKRNIYVLAGDKNVMVEAREAGDATVAIQIEAGGNVYRAEIAVNVTANVSVIPWTAGVSASAPLKFSALESLLAAECQTVLGEGLVSITGLTVATSQGIIYQGYKSPDDTGAGAGSSITYYASTASRVAGP